MKTQVIQELFKHNCIKTGEFTLKNGDISPIYINLKNVISKPHLLNLISVLLFEKLSILDYNRIIGVPYGGFIYSNALSVKYNIPSLFMRKEKKNYGLKKIIEGEYNHGDQCVIIEDTMTTGSSVIESINKIKHLININSILLVCDRRINKTPQLNDYKIYSLFNIYDIIETLYITSKIDNTFYYKLQNYFKVHKKNINTDIVDYYSIKNTFIKKITNKNTNVCLDIDLKNIKEIFKIIELYGNDILILKIYSDIIEDINDTKIEEFLKIKEKYNILIMDGKQYSKNESVFFQEFTKTNKKLFKWIDIISLTDSYPKSIYNIVYTINNKHNKNIKIVLDGYTNIDKTLYLLNTDNNVLAIYSDDNNIDNNTFNTVLKFKTYTNEYFKGKYLYFLKREMFYKNNIFISISNFKNHFINLWNLN